MLCVTAIYPAREGAGFDFDYYLETHIPLVLGFVGDNLIRWEVHRGVGETAHVCRTSFWIHSLERFQEMLGEHSEAIFADVSNYTTLQPYLQVEEVAGSGAVESYAAIWEDHVKYEFETRNTGDTLDTMVEDAYVNHIPTLTGGVGKEQLREFYSQRFIPRMPPDTEMTAVSRTVGEDRLVDEMIFKFTHTTEMDWMLPGIPPTGKRVEVPLVAIIHFRGDKLAHEHIYWDQASVLVQLGLLAADKLPVAGVETAQKVLDTSLPSNALIERADGWKAGG